MTQHTLDPDIESRRKGVRRTVMIATAVVAVFFLVSVLQILLMK